MYNRKDHYYKKAKEEGFASRAVYKLEQIQSKFRVIKKGDKVIDLGCAPGGWLQKLSEMVGGKGMVAGIDILPIKIKCPNNVKFVLGDINDEAALGATFAELGGVADVVVSDMAPNTSGLAFKDCYLSYELCMMALEVAQKILKENGNFVAKIFQGKELDDFRLELRKYFKKVNTYAPPATREGSKELYLVGIGYHSSAN